MKKLLLFLSLLLLLLTIYPEFQVSSNNTMAKYKFEDYNETNKQKNFNKPKNPALKIKDKNQIEFNNPKNKPLLTPQEVNDIFKPSQQLVLVNKNYGLPTNFKPQNLIIPDIPFSFKEKLPKKYMEKEAAKALEKLFIQAKQDNIDLVGVSAYRSYQRQKAIFAYNVRRKGEKAAKQISAQPGHSEHQTGLAIDVSSPSVNYQLTTKFGQTREGKWLAQVAPEYGFIIRYPKDKQQITGYQYEPWHLRYVGVKHASKIARNNITLERYLSNLRKRTS